MSRNRIAHVVITVAALLLILPRSPGEHTAARDLSRPKMNGMLAPGQADQIDIVHSSWRYEFDADSANPNKVFAYAVIENVSGGYLKNIAVRFTARYLNGSEIDHSTETPIRDVLAPGARTFIGTVIYDDSLALTDSVDLLGFGDSATEADDRFLEDPKPDYLIEEVDGEYIRYYGEITNTSGSTFWQARCDSCTAVTLYAVARVDELIVDYGSSYLGMAPNGHLAPGDRVAFRGGFERLPGLEIDYYYAVEPMAPGEFPTSWEVTDLEYEFEDGEFLRGWNISAKVHNRSEVPAAPDVWYVARNTEGAWMGWTSCFSLSDIPPQGTLDCSGDTLYSGNIHTGEIEDVASFEVLVASAGVSSIGPPTSTPTASPTPSSTPTPRPTLTPVPASWTKVHLPFAQRGQ